MNPTPPLPWWRVSTWIGEPLTRRQHVIAGAALMIVAQTALRAWAVFGSWFYSDDFIFLEDALKHDLTLSFLFRPHDSHLMPPGIAISWVVAHAGPYNWGLAATITVVLQLLASLACLRMLTNLFGFRLRVLVPLAFYLFSTMSLDGVIWWSAALNTLPLQLGFFLAVTAAVSYFRTRTLGSLVATWAAFAFGVLADPRGMLILLTVVLLAVGFFATGRWWKRPWTAFRTWWTLWTPLLVLGIGYLALYRHLTPSPVTTDASTQLGGTAATMLGTSFLTSIVGGPWRWDNSNPPMGAVDPFGTLRVVAAVVVVVALAYALHRSPLATIAAGLILAVHLGITFVGLALGRATQIGAGAGLLMRFLADSTPVVTLTLGLVIMGAAGATIRPHEQQFSKLTRPRRVVASSTLAAVVLGAVTSTALYARNWHEDYPARAFVVNARDSLQRDPATVADIPVPEIVQAATSFPYNLPSRLLYPLRKQLDTATSANDLQVLDAQGFHRQAEVPIAITAPRGPQRDCGYPIDSTPTTIGLPQRNNADFWWTTMSYISGGPSTIEVRADQRVVATMQVEPGTHTYFIQGEKPYGSLTLRSLTETTTCVDVITIGDTIVPAP
ncbi:hypothetical protein [Aeromicrobium sp.]|uniref:hypothetical protein n=1 Tax=Aeromicrobium sp. TaxID=1871063 RepID=UPI0019BE8134|nr:hypothetical protein [Aeromicrobium sp.]MBC7630268.1 hypothetical protein [Aeromicrobium sp.]